MARKTLEDFKKWDGSYDYQAFADYLESAECANDDGYIFMRITKETYTKELMVIGQKDMGIIM